MKYIIYNPTTVSNGRTHITYGQDLGRLITYALIASSYSEPNPVDHSAYQALLVAKATRQAEEAYVKCVNAQSNTRLELRRYFLLKDEYEALTPEWEEFLTLAFAEVIGETEGIPVYVDKRSSHRANENWRAYCD